LNVMTLYCLLAREILTLGLLDVKIESSLSRLIPLSYQQLALLLIILCTTIEYSVLNMADDRDVSVSLFLFNSLSFTRSNPTLSCFSHFLSHCLCLSVCHFLGK
jgi:hypothetical protein